MMKKKEKGGEKMLKVKGYSWDEGDDLNLSTEWICPLCGSRVSNNLGVHFNSDGCSICGFMRMKGDAKPKMPVLKSVNNIITPKNWL